MLKNKKLLILSILSVFVLVSLIGCASGGKDLAEFMNNDNELRIYEIFGMDCPGCHGGL